MALVVVGHRSGAALPRPSASLRLDVGCPNHLPPFLGFLRDELSEIGGRANKHRAVQVGKPGLDLGIGEAGIDLLVQPEQIEPT